jgi:hypothetical protein
MVFDRLASGSIRMAGIALLAGSLVLVLSDRQGHAAPPIPPVGYSAAPSLPTGFTPRWDFAYSYYPPSDQVVVFGGAPAKPGEGWYNDTWMYSGGVWSKAAAPPAGLTPRGGASMAYDPEIRRLVMFGGAGSSDWPPRNETWLWDGSRWTAGPVAPVGMQGRTGAGMAYDDDLRKVVLFAGTGNAPFNDVWLYDGVANAWTAGPATPAAVLARSFFGMTYDPLLHKVVVAGGDRTSNTWYFDGSAWTAGPTFFDNFSNKQRERTQLAYDPQMQADILFSGLGPAPSTDSVYYLRSTGWTYLYEDPSQPAFTPPSSRLEGAIVFVPTQDTMMLFGGVNSSNDGTIALGDAWFFREVAPQASSATLDQTAPLQTSWLNVTIGPVTGGYYKTTRTIRWLKNGGEIPGATGTGLSPQYGPGDQIQAQVQFVDQLGVTGPWVSSSVAVVAQPTLDADDGTPGAAVDTSGTGFGSEVVDLRIDAPNGALLRTVTTTPAGSWNARSVTLPIPLEGGTHTLYAIGETTGSQATTAVLVSPAGSVDPVKFASGSTTSFVAQGFKSGEKVTVSFPAGTPVSMTADSNGSVSGNLVSPAEPYPGGFVTASAPSATASVSYSVLSTMKVSGKAKPGQSVMVLTGMAPSESVKFTIDGAPGSQSFTSDSKGGLTATVTLISTWGKHTVTATGQASGVVLTKGLNYVATLTLDPISGPKGTVVAIDSGPGWGAGATVNLYWASVLRQVLVAGLDGSVHASFTIPSHPTGPTTFQVTDPLTLTTAKKTFTIT